MTDPGKDSSRRKRRLWPLLAVLSCLFAGAVVLWWLQPQHYETYTTVGVGEKHRALRIELPEGWKIEPSYEIVTKERESHHFQLVHIDDKGPFAWLADRLFRRSAKDWAVTALTINFMVYPVPEDINRYIREYQGFKANWMRLSHRRIVQETRSSCPLGPSFAFTAELLPDSINRNTQVFSLDAPLNKT